VSRNNACGCDEDFESINPVAGSPDGLGQWQTLKLWMLGK
jgi:hypothetical protein